MLIINNETSKLNTIKKFVNSGIVNSINASKNVRYAKYSNNTKAIPLENIFIYKYRTIILQYSRETVLSQEDQLRYKYRPKQLSYELYGTVEYWYILMILNNFATISDFAPKRLKYLPQENLSIIEEILMKEQPKLETKNNNMEIVKEL